MYNKLFTKILDSSIWLAPDPHRLVWVTLIAAMDEDGNAMFACPENLAARARVTVQQAESAIKAFESPDPKSGDPENEGRRIERFPGGWHVLNAHKYRALVTKAVARERTRERVARFRAKQAVTQCNDKVTVANVPVTPSEAEALSESISEAEATERAKALVLHESLPKESWTEWLAHRRQKRWPCDNRTLGKHLKILSAHSTKAQTDMIDTSINAGWQGLFSPKKNSDSRSYEGDHLPPELRNAAR